MICKAREKMFTLMVFAHQVGRHQKSSMINKTKTCHYKLFLDGIDYQEMRLWCFLLIKETEKSIKKIVFLMAKTWNKKLFFFFYFMKKNRFPFIFSLDHLRFVLMGIFMILISSSMRIVLTIVTLISDLLSIDIYKCQLS